MFKAMKFRVNNAQDSEALQKYLFSLGYQWRSTGRSIENYSDNFPNISTYADGNIYCVPDDYYKGHSHTEHTFTTEVIVKEIQPKPETITIDGKEYDKAAVAERLASLKAINE